AGARPVIQSKRSPSSLLSNASYRSSSASEKSGRCCSANEPTSKSVSLVPRCHLRNSSRLRRMSGVSVIGPPQGVEGDHHIACAVPVVTCASAPLAGGAMCPWEGCGALPARDFRHAGDGHGRQGRCERLRPEILFPLYAPVTTLAGGGPRVGKLFERLAGPAVVDLLWQLPPGIIDRRFAPKVHDAPAG